MMSALYFMAFFLFIATNAYAETYEQTYYADGKDHSQNVTLSSGGTHSFLVNGVPFGTYNYVAYRNTGSGYVEIWSDSTSTGWDPTVTTFVDNGYIIKLVIYDGSWNNVKSVYYWYIYVVETIYTPNTPTGPSSGETGSSLSYSTGGASSSLGHSIQYRFYWGDGSYSSWSSSTSASHTYSSPGTFSVQAQARCATHTSVVSSWSGAKSVEIVRPKAGDIIGVDPDFFTGSEKTVTVVVKNLGCDDANLIVEHTAPSGWSISPSSKQTNVSYNATNSSYFTFTVTPPSDAVNSSATIQWRLYYDDLGLSNMLLDTYSQSVSTTNVGNVSATLKNVGGNNAPAAGTKLILYTSPSQTKTGSNPASFIGVISGTHLIEGYQTGTFFGEEFWHSQNVTVTAGQTTNTTLTRTYPYAYEVILTKDGTVLNAGDEIPVEIGRAHV